MIATILLIAGSKSLSNIGIPLLDTHGMCGPSGGLSSVAPMYGSTGDALPTGYEEPSGGRGWAAGCHKM